MSNALQVAAEFPFMGAVPKREQSKRMKLMEVLEIIQERAKSKGPVVPQSLASDILGVSRQRIHQLVEEGRIDSFEINGTKFVYARSLQEFLHEDRKPGRPKKVGLVQGLKRAGQIGYALAEACDGPED